MKGNINLISYDCYQQATEKQLAGLKWKENRVYYISEIHNSHCQTKAMGSIKGELHGFRRFASFMYDRFPEVKHFTEISRDMIEDYLVYIKTDTGLTSVSYTTELSVLDNLLDEIGRELEIENICNLFLSSDCRAYDNALPEAYYQFKDALNALSVAVQAGYSVENAVAACSRDLERLYPKETDIVKEFHYIETQLRVSVPVEELLLSLGDRSGIEDVENFAAVFYTAKRTGGDMNRIIQTSARMLGDKIDVRKEIETTLAAKKAEQMIMSLMPAGIILYLKLTSPGFLSVLYGNLFGMCAMTLCLGIYVLSYWLGRRIVDIEV